MLRIALAAMPILFYAAIAGATVKVTPGTGWNGTAGSGYGGSPPIRPSTLYGSGCLAMPCVSIDEPSYNWLTTDTVMTIITDHADREGIAAITVYCEGNTFNIPVNEVVGGRLQSRMGKSIRTGVCGYQFNLAASLFSQDGDVQIYILVKPVNGYARLLGASIPNPNLAVGGTFPRSLIYTCNAFGTIVRPNRYMNPIAGNDSYDGRSATFMGGTTGPWATINGALNNGLTHLPDGSLVHMAGGSIDAPMVYTEISNNNNMPVTNARQITFIADSGLGTVTVTRNSRDVIKPWGLHLLFQNVNFDMSMIECVYTYADPNATLGYENCSFIDPNGPGGPAEGYSEIENNGLGISSAGQQNFACECIGRTVSSSGCNLYRNCNFTHTYDSCDIVSPECLVNSQFIMPFIGHLRFSTQAKLTVSTVTRNSPVSGETTIGFTTDSQWIAKWPCEITFLTGSLARNTYATISEATSTRSCVVSRLVSPSPGDTCYVYGLNHSDNLQVISSSLPLIQDNIIMQRCLSNSDGVQPFFFQAGTYSGAGKLSVDSSGLILTTTSPHGAYPGQFVCATDGAINYFAKILSTPTTTTMTVDIRAPFPAGANGLGYCIANTTSSVSYSANVVTGIPAAAQLQCGCSGIAIRQNTFLNVGAYHLSYNDDLGGGDPIIIRNTAITRGNPDWGAFADITCRDNYLGLFAMANWSRSLDGFVIDNNFYSMSPSNLGTHVGGPSTASQFDSSFWPLSENALNTIPAGRADTFPFDYYGNPLALNGSDSIGAVCRPQRSKIATEIRAH